MATPSIPAHITKKEVEERFDRSHRSLTREFSRAIRVGDTEVLQHLKLLTEDGEIRDGSEVSLAEIQELSNQGLMPTWYVQTDWAEQKYGAKSKQTKRTQPEQKQKPFRRESAQDHSEGSRDWESPETPSNQPTEGTGTKQTKAGSHDESGRAVDEADCQEPDRSL